MKKLLITITIFAFALAVSKLAFGQTTAKQPAASKAAQRQTSTAPNAAKRQWFYIIENNLKLGALNDYMELRVKERVPALKKGGVKHQEVWTSSIGAGGKLFTIEPLDDLGVLDGPSPLTKALGTEGTRALAARTQQYFVEGGHSYLAQSRPELSWTSEMKAPPKFAIVGRVKVARGRATDYQNYIKNDYLPVVKKSGARGYQVLSVRYGGDMGEYITLTFFDSFAELEKNDPSNASVLNRVLGEATAQKTVQKTVGVILNVERNILRFRPDLSILP